MKKSVVMKIFLVVLVSLMLIITTSYVQAVDNTTGYQDLTNLTGNNTTGNNTSGNNTANNNSANNTARNNTARNNSNALNTGAVTNSNRNNTNTYNNSSLPKTGVEDSIPTMLLLVVFGISAVYAYKKIKEYKNI